MLFTEPSQVSLATLIQRDVLPLGSDGPYTRTNELFEHRKYFPQIASGSQRTTKAVIKAMVDVTAESGANTIMIHTSILTKVINACLIDTRSDGMVDINSHVVRDGTVQQGILSLDDLQFFVDYCHYRGVAANVAGSIESYQAQQLWVLLPELDQAFNAKRGFRSGSRPLQRRSGRRGYPTAPRYQRNLVRGLAPPEHGGVLNLPESLKTAANAGGHVKELIAFLRDRRKALGFPELQAYWVDAFGQPTPIEAA